MKQPIRFSNLLVGLTLILFFTGIMTSTLLARGRTRPVPVETTETPAPTEGGSDSAATEAASTETKPEEKTETPSEPTPPATTDTTPAAPPDAPEKDPGAAVVPTPAELTDIASMSGLASKSLSVDFAEQYVVSTRSSVSRSKNVVTWYLMYTRTEDVLKTLSTMYEAEMSAGDIKIAENPVTNAIVIRTKDPTNPIVQDIMEVIGSLDFRPGQVLIDVLVVELKVDNKDLFDFELKALGRSPLGMSNSLGTLGLDHGKIDQADPGTTSNGFKAFITSQNKLKLFLNASKTKDKVNIISSPHIVAANHRKATFKIGDKVPIITSVRPSDAGPIKTFEIKEVGIELSVTPHINRGQDIDMEILQTINNLSSYNETEGTAQMTNREVQTNISVPNGETLILGGFIEEKKSAIESKIPLLSNIPGIGKAFTKKDIKSNKTEILVFLTPRILDTVEDQKNITTLQASKFTNKEKLASLLKERKYAPPPLPANQEIIIDRASRGWKYDFGTQAIDVITWQIPAELDPTVLKLTKNGACPFGFGPSKRLTPPFIRTLLQPSEGALFMKEFALETPAKFKTLSLNVASNNAAAVYLNGKLVDEDPYVKLKDGHDYEYWNRSRNGIPASLLKAGTNNVVVILGNDKTTTDGYFDMMLLGNK